MSDQAKAAGRVMNAVRAGKLAPIKTQRCTDCGAPATGYDHRDYAKPLDVNPVCARCNARRGRADNHDGGRSWTWRKIDPDLWRRLKVAAAERDLTLKEAIRLAIEGWLQAQEGKP